MIFILGSNSQHDLGGGGGAYDHFNGLENLYFDNE